MFALMAVRSASAVAFGFSGTCAHIYWRLSLGIEDVRSDLTTSPGFCNTLPVGSGEWSRIRSGKSADREPLRAKSLIILEPLRMQLLAGRCNMQQARQPVSALQVPAMTIFP